MTIDTQEQPENKPQWKQLLAYRREAKRLSAIAYEAIVTAVNHGRSPNSVDWEDVMQAKYDGTGQEKDFTNTQSLWRNEALNNNEVIAIEEARLATRRIIHHVVKCNKPEYLNERIKKILEHSINDPRDTVTIRKGIWLKMSAVGSLVIAGLRAAKAAYLELHPDQQPSLER